MKKILLLITLCTLFIGVNAHAATYRISPYVALDLGMNTSSDTSLYSVGIGGKLHTNYGLEVSYTNYGKGLDTNGFAIDAVGYFPTRHVIFLALLGYGMQASSIDLDNTTLTSTGPRLAGGAQYRFTRDIAGRGLIRYSMFSNHQNAIDITFGVSYSF